jgi:hypothetical protein
MTRAYREHEAAAKEEWAGEPHDPQPHVDKQTKFVSTGAIPPVGGGFSSAGPTAGDRAFGTNSYASPFKPLTGAQKHADHVARTTYIYDTAQNAAIGILSGLVPGYLKARDELNVNTVAQLGGQLIGAFSLVHGAKSALDEMLRKATHQSTPGLSPDEDLELARTQQAVEAKASILNSLIPIVDGMIATTLTPHLFHGQEVAGQVVVVDLEGAPGARRGMKLGAELERTLSMLVLIDELKASLFDGKKGMSPTNLDSARKKVGAWASRPLDLAFLRAALGPIWQLLDETATGPLTSKPSDMLGDATKQANHTGWLGDIGRFDVHMATSELQMGGRESSEFVVRQLYTADPDARAGLLMQIKQRKLLDALCSPLGWADVKALHDSLGVGFSEIKTDLQKYFIGGKDLYGPSLDSEWERHDSSLHSLVARIPGVGGVANFVLDIATFGFNSSYGKALDDRSEGLTSESEAHSAKVNAVNRTAAVAAISMLTGGLADKAVRGGAGAVTATRAAFAGAAGGSVGAVTGLATSDAYGVYIGGDQKGFSSPEEYVKAALLGGVVGGAFGGVLGARSNRARALAGPESAPVESLALGEGGASLAGGEFDTPLTEPTLSGQRTPATERIDGTASKAGISVRALSSVQRELLVAADNAVTSGEIHGAIKLFDELVASGVPRSAVDKLEAGLAHAAGKTSPAVYRNPRAILPNATSVEPSVYGGTRYYGTNEITPATAFEKGLPARGPNTELLPHARQGQDSAFRGTTTKVFDEAGGGGAGEWAQDGGWVYKIDGTPSWDMNAQLEGRVPLPDGTFGGNPMPGENEGAILAGVPRERIVGAIPINELDGGLVQGPMVSNPHYVPLR